MANKEEVTQLGCWAHARRRFADILKSGASDTQSKKYAKELVAMVAQQVELFLVYPRGISSLRSQHFTYLKNQLPKLSIYTEDGRLNIDNNIAENHVRPIAVGRKNWLFATSTKGATTLCNLFSSLEC